MDSLALSAGDICPDCRQEGLTNRLREFLINLEDETLLKCESDECMYPYNDELISTDDDETGDIEENFELFASKVFDNIQYTCNTNKSEAAESKNILEYDDSKEHQQQLVTKYEHDYLYQSQPLSPTRKSKTIRKPVSLNDTVKKALSSPKPGPETVKTSFGLPKASLRKGSALPKPVEAARKTPTPLKKKKLKLKSSESTIKTKKISKILNLVATTMSVATDMKSPTPLNKKKLELKSPESTIKSRKGEKNLNQTSGSKSPEHATFIELSKNLFNNINTSQRNEQQAVTHLENTCEIDTNVHT